MRLISQWSVRAGAGYCKQCNTEVVCLLTKVCPYLPISNFSLITPSSIGKKEKIPCKHLKGYILNK